jgi:hypothetical protein
MLHTIVLNTYVLPHLPPPLYKLAYPRLPGTLSLTDTPQTASLSDTLSSRSSASGSGHSNTSIVSALSIPSGTGTRTLQQRGTHFANVNPDNALLNLVSPGTKIKGLMGDNPPPLLDNGKQPCLSYLLHGGCWSTCRRASSHGHILTAGERERLQNYLRTRQLQSQHSASASAAPIATARGTSTLQPPP